MQKGFHLAYEGHQAGTSTIKAWFTVLAYRQVDSWLWVLT